MGNPSTLSDQCKTKSNFNSKKYIVLFRISNGNNNEHSRRLIQTAFVRFQQLNECNDLNDEQKQWIQTWMDAVSNVRSLQSKVGF
jgi:hypothetical protein